MPPTVPSIANITNIGNHINREYREIVGNSPVLFIVYNNQTTLNIRYAKIILVIIIVSCKRAIVTKDKANYTIHTF